MTTTIDTEELFRVLSDFDAYPAGAAELSGHARSRGASETLIAFLNRLPGQVDSEAEVFARAADPDKEPMGTVIDTAGIEGTAEAAKGIDDELHIEEVTGEETTEKA